MLKTPFGTIEIVADCVQLDYEAVPYVPRQNRSGLERPFDGCYKLTALLPFHPTDVCCKLKWERPPVLNGGVYGAGYLSAEFADEGTLVIIGGVYGDPVLPVFRFCDGIGYDTGLPTAAVSFWVAWAVDCGIDEVPTCRFDED